MNYSTNQAGILVVEDDQELLKATKQFLSKNENTKVLTAINGPEAVLIASNQKVGVALIDIRLPGGFDGIEAAHRIRNLDPKIKIFFMTACAHDQNLRLRMKELALMTVQFSRKVLWNRGIFAIP